MSRVIDAILRMTDQFSKPASAALKSMTSMSAAAVRVGKDVQKTGKKISDFGSGLTAAVSIPIAGVAGAAGKMALDFENSVAKVSTIADTTVMSLDDIRRQALITSNATGIAVTDILEAQYNAISAGASTADSLSLVEVAAKAAKGGFTDAGTALDGLTSVYNSFQGAVDYQTISDQFMVAQNFGKTTFGELASSMGQVTPIANSLNVSTNELLSSIAVLTKNGIATSQSVTGLKAAYSNILKPTSDAQKTAKSLGLEFNAAHLKSVGWVQFLAEIREKTGGNTDTMAKLFGSVEALNAVTVLAGAGFNDVNTAMGMMAESAGMTENAYQKMMTPTERCTIAVNKLKNTAIQVGERFVPVFERVVGIVDRAADRLASLSDAQIDTAIKAAGIAAAVGPVIVLFGKMVSGVGKTITVVNRFGVRVKAAGGILKLMISPANLVVAGLLALIAVVLICVKNIDRLKAGFQTAVPAFDKVRSGFAGIYTQIQPLIPILQKVGSIIWDVLQVVVVGAVSGAVGAFAGFLTGVTTIVDGIITMLSGLITFITGVFTGNWSQAWTGVQTVFEGIVNAIAGIFKGVINTIAGAVNGVIGAINGMTVPEWVPGIGGKSVNLPLIPQLASGTKNWEGGIAQIHERGGEIIDLPAGSRVYPHDRSVSMARSEGRMEGITAFRNAVSEAQNLADRSSKIIQFPKPPVNNMGTGPAVRAGSPEPREPVPVRRDMPKPGMERGNTSQQITIAKLADQIIVREEQDIKKLAEELTREMVKHLNFTASNMGGDVKNANVA